jgi:hypothetical protein
VASSLPSRNDGSMGDFESIRAIKPARKAQRSDQTSTARPISAAASPFPQIRVAHSKTQAKIIAAQRAYAKGGRENIGETKN